MRTTRHQATAETPAGEGQRLLTVAIKDIAASPDNTRLFESGDTEESEALRELAASIRDLGLQQPPKVRAAEPGAASLWV